ncbi:hypothetical protein [Pseudonocardia dioxanivorans]|uniref:hypothetical protein n=1 Tax=Pseudonocardia dioxanivorans TaxID=240495 RepID=UPI000CD2B0BE|nr:hypothetical protein [Pseudonocardia dioxanivorans]
MTQWINLPAIGNILLLGLVFGAGLPALVAVGVTMLDTGRTSGTDGTERVAASPARQTVAYLCFAVVLAAIAFGIYEVVTG